MTDTIFRESRKMSLRRQDLGYRGRRVQSDGKSAAAVTFQKPVKRGGYRGFSGSLPVVCP